MTCAMGRPASEWLSCSVWVSLNYRFQSFQCYASASQTVRLYTLKNLLRLQRTFVNVVCIYLYSLFKNENGNLKNIYLLVILK